MATNAEMRKELETDRSTLRDLVKIYSRMIDEKISVVVATKQALNEELTEGYALMDKFHDWLGNLAIKNQQIYPLWEQLQMVFFQ